MVKRIKEKCTEAFVQTWGPENVTDEPHVTLGTVGLDSALSRRKGSKHRDAWRLEPCHPSAVLRVVANVWKVQKMIPTAVFI